MAAISSRPLRRIQPRLGSRHPLRPAVRGAHGIHPGLHAPASHLALQLVTGKGDAGGGVAGEVFGGQGLGLKELTWSTPARRLQTAIGAMFVLGAIGANAFTYLTPIWLVALFMVALCGLSAFSLVFSIAWLRDGTATRKLAIGCVALSLISGIGALLRFPLEMDSETIVLSATMGMERSRFAASALQSATMAMEAADPSARLAYAGVAYRMTGQVIKYRDGSGQPADFSPDADLRRSVEDSKSRETRVKAALDDFLAKGFQRQVVKLFALVTFLASVCTATFLVGLSPKSK